MEAIEWDKVGGKREGRGCVNVRMRVTVLLEDFAFYARGNQCTNVTDYQPIKISPGKHHPLPLLVTFSLTGLLAMTVG